MLSVPAGMFYCLTVSGLQQGIEMPSGTATVAALAASILLPCLIALWVLADARQRHDAVPYDFGAFVFFAWPVLVPIHLFCTRGWRGFVPVVMFILIYLGAVAFAHVPWLFVDDA